MQMLSSFYVWSILHAQLRPRLLIVVMFIFTMDAKSYTWPHGRNCLLSFWLFGFPSLNDDDTYEYNNNNEHFLA